MHEEMTAVNRIFWCLDILFLTQTSRYVCKHYECHFRRQFSMAGFLVSMSICAAPVVPHSSPYITVPTLKKKPNCVYSTDISSPIARKGFINTVLVLRVSAPIIRLHCGFSILAITNHWETQLHTSSWCLIGKVTQQIFCRIPAAF